MKLTTTTESNHEELMALMNPLLDFMIKNKYSYFLVAGKDNICTRHLRGDYDEVHGMIIGMMQSQKQVGALLTDIVNDFKPTEK